jgi:hypothetical protein
VLAIGANALIVLLIAVSLVPLTAVLDAKFASTSIPTPKSIPTKPMVSTNPYKSPTLIFFYVLQKPFFFSKKIRLFKFK